MTYLRAALYETQSRARYNHLIIRELEFRGGILLEIRDSPNSKSETEALIGSSHPLEDCYEPLVRWRMILRLSRRGLVARWGGLVESSSGLASRGSFADVAGCGKAPASNAG